MIAGIKFAQPYFFLLLLLIPAMIAFYLLYTNKKRTQITFSGFENFVGIKQSFKQRFHFLPLGDR